MAFFAGLGGSGSRYTKRMVRWKEGWKPLDTDFQPPIHYVTSKLTFDNENKIFRSGEIIYGSFIVIEVPEISPQYTGLILQLDALMYFKGTLNNSPKKLKRVMQRQYIFGDGGNGMGRLKVGEYKFEFYLPQDCPCTFITGKLGSLKYSLTCIAFQGADGYYSFKPSEEVTILVNTISKWGNQEERTKQMFIERHIFLEDIHIWLNTDQICYEPGQNIRFGLKFENTEGRNIQILTLQLIQIVNYNLESESSESESIKSKQQNENIILLEIDLVPTTCSLESKQIWEGELKIPNELQPSIQEPLPVWTTISMQYILQVNLRLDEISSRDIIEKFPIEIGCPLKIHSNKSNTKNQPLIPLLIFGGNVQDSLNFNTRRMSMSSLTPSLPDYDTAVSDIKQDDDVTLPPSYSCIELNND